MKKFEIIESYKKELEPKNNWDINYGSEIIEITLEKHNSWYEVNAKSSRGTRVDIKYRSGHRYCGFNSAIVSYNKAVKNLKETK